MTTRARLRNRMEAKNSKIRKIGIRVLLFLGVCILLVYSLSRQWKQPVVDVYIEKVSPTEEERDGPKIIGIETFTATDGESTRQALEDLDAQNGRVVIDDHDDTEMKDKMSDSWDIQRNAGDLDSNDDPSRNDQQRDTSTDTGDGHDGVTTTIASHSQEFRPFSHEQFEKELNSKDNEDEAEENDDISMEENGNDEGDGNDDEDEYDSNDLLSWFRGYFSDAEDKTDETIGEKSTQNSDERANTTPSTTDNSDDITTPRVGDVTDVTTSQGDDVTEVTTSQGDDVTEVTTSQGDAATEVTTSQGDSVTEVTTSHGDDVTEVTTSHGDDVTEVTTSQGDGVTEVTTSLGEDVTDITTTQSNSDVTTTQSYTGVTTRPTQSNTGDKATKSNYEITTIQSSTEIINTQSNTDPKTIQLNTEITTKQPNTDVTTTEINTDVTTTQSNTDITLTQPNVFTNITGPQENESVEVPISQIEDAKESNVDNKESPIADGTDAGGLTGQNLEDINSTPENSHETTTRVLKTEPNGEVLIGAPEEPSTINPKGADLDSVIWANNTIIKPIAFNNNAAMEDEILDESVAVNNDKRPQVNEESKTNTIDQNKTLEGHGSLQTINVENMLTPQVGNKTDFNLLASDWTARNNDQAVYNTIDNIRKPQVDGNNEYNVAENNLVSKVNGETELNVVESNLSPDEDDTILSNFGSQSINSEKLNVVSSKLTHVGESSFQNNDSKSSSAAMIIKTTGQLPSVENVDLTNSQNSLPAQGINKGNNTAVNVTQKGVQGLASGTKQNKPSAKSNDSILIGDKKESNFYISDTSSGNKRIFEYKTGGDSGNANNRTSKTTQEESKGNKISSYNDSSKKKFNSINNINKSERMDVNKGRIFKLPFPLINRNTPLPPLTKYAKPYRKHTGETNNHGIQPSLLLPSRNLPIGVGKINEPSSNDQLMKGLEGLGKSFDRNPFRNSNNANSPNYTPHANDPQTINTGDTVGAIVPDILEHGRDNSLPANEQFQKFSVNAPTFETEKGTTGVSEGYKSSSQPTRIPLTSAANAYRPAVLESPPDISRAINQVGSQSQNAELPPNKANAQIAGSNEPTTAPSYNLNRSIKPAIVLPNPLLPGSQAYEKNIFNVQNFLKEYQKQSFDSNDNSHRESRIKKREISDEKFNDFFYPVYDEVLVEDQRRRKLPEALNINVGIRGKSEGHLADLNDFPERHSLKTQGDESIARSITNRDELANGGLHSDNDLPLASTTSSIDDNNGAGLSTTLPSDDDFFYSNPKPLSDDDFKTLRTLSFGERQAEDQVKAPETEFRDQVEDATDVVHSTPPMFSVRYNIRRTDVSQVNDMFPCPRQISLSDSRHPATALVSFPGVVTKWMRQALEQLTGESSDSIYRVISKMEQGDTGPLMQINHRVVIETHTSFSNTFERAIVLLKNPLAVEEKHLRFRPFSIDWQYNFLWAHNIISWLESDIPLLVLTFEDMIENLDGYLAMISEFLNVDPQRTSVSCAMRESPPLLVNDVTRISGVYSQDRKRVDKAIDSVIDVAAKTCPHVMRRLFMYKSWTTMY